MIKNKKTWLAAGLLFLLFLAILLAVKLIDVQPIGPENSVIGLAALNAGARDLFGVNMFWYDVTDLFGLVAIAVAGCFGVLGFLQMLQRKSLLKVDADILLLGGFYAAVIAIYVLFEVVVINYRPILMDGQLEASFPSSHTMLVTCIMGSVMVQFCKRISKPALRKVATVLSALMIAVTVIGRMICGVHWLTDILAGLFLSGAMILAYAALCEKAKK